MLWESQKTNTLKPILTLSTLSATAKPQNGSDPNSPNKVPAITAIPIWEQAYAEADNPYYQTDIFDYDSVLRSSCGSIWSTYFYQWMATVDIKTMDPPFSTSLQWITSTGGIMYYGYDWTTSAALTITAALF
jgi:hypothetical protein